MNSTKIAFVHDWLYYVAGAEQVFFDMIGKQLQDIEKHETGNKIKQTQAKVFVMFSNKHKLTIRGHELEIVTAIPRRLFAIFVYFDKHKTSVFSKLFDYRNLMFFYPLLIWILQNRIKQFQVNEIHISSFAVAKNIAAHKQTANCNKLQQPITILHAQSPFMYIHNHYRSNLSKLKFPIKQLYRLATRYLKPRDLQPRHYDNISANSTYTAQLLKQIYGYKDIQISYPKLSPLFFHFPIHRTKSDYFIFIGRLVCFSKQVDIIIQAFNQTGQTLKIIGSGPDEQYLQSIAGSNIEFLGRISDPEHRCELISKAKGLVNITLESFGYVTAESLCLGTPVVGYNKGATPELMGNAEPGTQNGILIEQQTVAYLVAGLEQFEQKTRDYERIAQEARTQQKTSNIQFQLS